jgi:hypothetical protein
VEPNLLGVFLPSLKFSPKKTISLVETIKRKEAIMVKDDIIFWGLSAFLAVVAVALLIRPNSFL